VVFFYWRGWLLYYGDAEAHLNIARRIIDSQTPGYDQVGTVWLPLPHWLVLPFVRVDSWWRSGIAGAIPSAACLVTAGTFLFAAARRLWNSTAAAVAAAALFALNPNLLYIHAVPMSEPAFFAAFMALFYFTTRFRQTQRYRFAAAAGLAACAGTLARYHMWFLIPFVALYIAITAKNRVAAAVLFIVLAALGPLFWLAHNWWLTGDPLDFYRGPYATFAIQGNADYPGKGEWVRAAIQFRTAAVLCAGPALRWIAAAGILAALWKRAFWPLAFLVLPGIFSIWSVHSSATPIFVPTLWPNSYYNSRYGLALLPLAVVAAAALVSAAPRRIQALAAGAVVVAASVPWLLDTRPGNWVVFEEARVNSEARRAWTRQAAEYLASRYVPGSGIITSFGDLTGIFRESGIPLRETFTGDNGLAWDAAVTRPELFLWQEWAVAMRGDPVDRAVQRAGYTLENSIMIKGAPQIAIYRRTGGKGVTS